MCHRLSRGYSTFSKGISRREEGRGSRRLWAAAGGSLVAVGAHAARHAPAKCLPSGGLFMDLEDDRLLEATPMEMNELAALTHTSLLKQASCVAVDAAIQLLHRTLRATQDFSQQHRKQLQEVIELLEYCTATLRYPEEHDRLWDLLVVARARADALKHQLRDLDLLMTYACSAVENIAMAAYISGSEFSASAARQITDSAKLELRSDERKREELEMQYTLTHTHYMEAAQKMVDDDAAGGTDEAVDDDDATTKGGGERDSVDRKGKEEEKEGEEEGRRKEGKSDDGGGDDR